jgi:predicted dehydrogenase
VSVSKLRTAVVGVGYLGRFHAEKHRALDEVELVGVCDLDEQAARAVAESLGTRCFADYRDLEGQIDAVTIAASTAAHFEIAKFFLEHGVHVLVEKPMTRTTQEAAALTALAERRKLKLQVGHVERFNPALLSAREGLTAVSFLECHRLAQFKGRGADVNVILDLMIHDLDVILSLVDSKPVSVSAVGIPVLTDDVDIANARIEFANRAIANVTASRASTSAQRKLRVWCPNQYVSIDFGAGEVRRVTRRGHPSEGQPALAEESWNLDKGDALLAETRSFVESIRLDRPCAVSGADGLAALELAEWIGSEIARRAQATQHR